jgi:hypothetical protein
MRCAQFGIRFKQPGLRFAVATVLPPLAGLGFGLVWGHWWGRFAATGSGYRLAVAAGNTAKILHQGAAKRGQMVGAPYNRRVLSTLKTACKCLVF